MAALVVLKLAGPPPLTLSGPHIAFTSRISYCSSLAWAIRVAGETCLQLCEVLLGPPLRLLDLGHPSDSSIWVFQVLHTFQTNRFLDRCTWFLRMRLTVWSVNGRRETNGFDTYHLPPELSSAYKCWGTLHWIELVDLCKLFQRKCRELIHQEYIWVAYRIGGIWRKNRPLVRVWHGISREIIQMAITTQ